MWISSCVSKIQIHILLNTILWQNDKNFEIYSLWALWLALKKTLPFQNRLSNPHEIKPKLCRKEYSMMFDSLYDDPKKVIFPQTHHGAPLCSVSTRISGFFTYPFVLYWCQGQMLGPLTYHGFYFPSIAECYIVN